MYKRVTTQVLLMVLTLFIPLVAFFIPAYSMNCRLKIDKNKQWQFNFFVYLIFLAVLIVFQLSGMYTLIFGSSSKGLIPMYFTHSFEGVVILWCIFVVMFLGFEMLLLLLAQKTKLNGFNQLVIVVIIMSSIAYSIVEMIKKPVMVTLISQMNSLIQANPKDTNVQYLIEQVNVLRANYILILFLSVFVMVLITYCVLFKKYLFGFHMSYYFTLVYAILFLMKYIPNINQSLLSSYSTLIMAGYSLYLCKELFYIMKNRGRNRSIIVVLIVILCIVLPLFLLFILGALMSFRVLKTYKIK
ncbi:MAG: hypothetical protein NTX05_07035 [Fusobacteria bacterium]|nr:hypothetical protein [Fusobacteriota bacterium]